MKITILAVGKVKEAFYRQAIGEFEKRLRRYCKLEIIEVADEKTPDRASETEEQMIREKEGERLLKYIKEDAWVCVLAIDGTMLDSIELAERVEKLGVQGVRPIQLVGGGSLGRRSAVVRDGWFKV